MGIVSCLRVHHRGIIPEEILSKRGVRRRIANGSGPNTNLRCGRYMKTQSFLLRTSLLFLFALLASPAIRLAAQTQPASAAQTASQAVPAVPSRITQAIDETQLVTLKGNVHPLARAEFDQGPVSDAQPMNRIMLMLQRSPAQQAALNQLMAEQLSKDSPNFHKWLTPQQFGQQFGPSDTDIQAVTDWLTQHGFQGFKVGKGKTIIQFSGNVALVRNTFHTDIHKFAVNGKQYSANVSNPQIPAALAPVIKGIVSLHNFPNKSMRHEGGFHKVSRNSSGLPQFTTSDGCGSGGSQPCYFVGPADFAKIYNIPSNLDGTGVIIGIVGDSNIDPNDVVDFRTIFGLSPTTGPNIIVDGPDPGIGGPDSDEGEADLDTQMAGAVAPKATIDFVVAETTFTSEGTDLAAFHIIDENLTDVVSESFGNCEAGLLHDGLITVSPSFNFYSSLWEEAAAQGITVMVSAGDNGSAACDDFQTEAVATLGLAVNGIASTPFNVAVGGTDFDDVGTQSNFWTAAQPNDNIVESAKGYIPERTWNISCAATATSANLNTICAGANGNGIVAASGGPSAFVPKPAFQTALTPADGSRDLPDISLFSSIGSGSNSLYAVCEADATGGQPSCSGNNFLIGEVGGTSASSPGFAGIMALINQKLGGRQGNANFVLYQIAGKTGQSCNSSTEALSGSTCAFNDVTKGNDSVPCTGNSLNCSSKVATTNGVLVDPNHTTTPAWTTGTGYDYATGLGSVNVANLATQWVTAVGAFKGSTSSLTLNGGTSTVSIKHGTSVTATATVNSTTTGTPSGDVSLLGPAGMINTGISDATLSGGSPNTANLTTTFLPGGSYSVTAHYTGDGTFAPSNSNAVPVVVSKENSRLQYEILLIDPSSGNLTTVGATSFAYGANFEDLRMDILNSSSGLCQIFPPPNTPNPDLTGCAPDATGSVIITDNGSPLAGSPFNINSAGHAEDQTLQLTGGTHTLSATYSGDLSYNPITTGVTSPLITVSKATTTTALVDCCAAGFVGQSYTVSATVSSVSTGVVPSGTISLFSGTTQVAGPVTLSSIALNPQQGVAQSSASLTTSTLTGGSNSLTVQYSGDGNYQSSVSAAQLAQIAFTDVTALALSSTTVQVGSNITFTATVTPNQNGSPAPTGTVQFTIDGKSPPTSVNLMGGMAQLSTSSLAVGIHSVQAFYPGDANFASSASPTMNFTVAAQTGSYALSGAPVTVTAGMSGMSLITVTPSGGFMNAVAVTCPTPPPGVTCTPNPLNVNITSANPVASNLSVNVAAPSTALMASAAVENQMLSAANASPSGNAKGWWTLSGGTGLAALVLLLLPGRKRYRAALGLGLVCVLSFTLGCGGGSSGGGGGGGAPTATTTQLTVSATKVASTGMITVSATVSGGTPTGNVQFFVDGAAAGTAVPVSGGTTGNITVNAASVPPLFQLIGTHTLSAHYLGSATTLASQSGSLNIAVTGTTQLSISGNPAPSNANPSLTLTIN